jgi:gas vesicle protein GvpG
MGLITGLLTLPLAPVRGVAWIAEQLAAEADRELYGSSETVRRELTELQRDRAFGQIDDQEYTEREAALLAQLSALRRRTSD